MPTYFVGVFWEDEFTEEIFYSTLLGMYISIFKYAISVIPKRFWIYMKFSLKKWIIRYTIENQLNCNKILK